MERVTVLLCFRGRQRGEYTRDRWDLKAQARPSANLFGLGCFEHLNLYCLFLSDNLFNLNIWDSVFGTTNVTELPCKHKCLCMIRINGIGTEAYRVSVGTHPHCQP